LRRHLPDWPVVSLDAIRAEMGVAAGDEQGAVVNRARALAREHLRQGRSFVWNATNLSRQMREGLVNLFAEYGARVRIVYVEAPFARQARQNRARAAPVPERVIEALRQRWEVPDPTEAHEVTWVVEQVA
jgi:predicted kinase